MQRTQREESEKEGARAGTGFEDGGRGHEPSNADLEAGKGEETDFI